MRGLKSTIALLAALLGLGAYIYFVTWRQPEGGAEEAKERVFVSLDGDKIDEIRVKSESGDATTLKKSGEVWQVMAPLSAKADTTEVAAITSNLATLEITRVVDENPADLKEYGLDAPRAEIEFKASGDTAYGDYHRLFLGAKSPTGGDLFVRHDADKRVILVPGYVDPIFNRSTFNLRDKTLVALDREKVDRIAVSAAGKTTELAKDGPDWKLTKPVMAGADYVSVESLVGRLVGATMKSIVAEQGTPADLKKYGFDKPQLTATVNSGNAATSLIIGGNVNDNEIYVRDSSGPVIATADKALLTDLQKGPDEYRRKDIFVFSVYSADRLELTRNGQTIVFEKVKADGQAPEKWRRVGPNPGDPDAMNMDNLLSQLQNLKAATFLDSAAKANLAKPSLTVLARLDGGKQEERVTFSGTGTDVYAAVPGQPGAVTIASDAFDEVIKALDTVSK